MELAFYRVEAGNWIDRAIGLCNRGPFSHVELVLRRNGNEGYCFSSSPRDGGVRFKHITFDPGKWVFVEVSPRDAFPRDAPAVKEVWDFCNETHRAGGKYDFAGVAGFVLPWAKDDGRRWFCSEICTAALQAAGQFLFAVPSRIGPNELYAMARADDEAFEDGMAYADWRRQAFALPAEKGAAT